jgi:D-alanyl-D-alanine carboxypeptidase (penicillin-binding protein 5/6)
MSDNFDSPFSKFPIFRPGAIIVFVIALICIISIVHFHNNHPNLVAKPNAPTVTLPGQFSVTFPAQGESAIGTDNFGMIASSSDQSPVPIASVTKIMTAYIVLKAHPLQPGDDGPTLTMTAQDVADYTKDLAQGDSVLKVAVGEKLTEKQLLEGLMLPSGDNIATTLARWVSGTEPAFIAKMNETAKALGMTQTHYADTSGVSPATVSNAVDQIKIAQAAMKDPIFREIVALPQATFPSAGTVYNVNSMLGSHGIAGIKTGSSLEAGGCFVSATPITFGSKTYYIIGVVLGQKTYQSLQSALDANAKMLDQVRPEFKLYPLQPSPNGFGQIIAPWSNNSDLQSTKPIQIFGYPGMTASLAINLHKTQPPVSPGESVATLQVQSGSSIEEFPLQNSKQINPPSALWRFFRNWL